jgi:hypothetical protein
MSPPRPLPQLYSQRVHLFLAAVAQGMPEVAALAAFAQVGCGQFSHDDKCFFQENVVLGPVADRVGLLPGAERLVVGGCAGEADITLLLVDGMVTVAALVSGRSLRSQWCVGPLGVWNDWQILVDMSGLPRDEDGKPIIPTSRVTVLVEAREAWGRAGYGS